MPACANGVNVHRRGIETPNITAVVGNVKGTWAHTVLGLKLTGWKSLISNVSRWGEVAAVVPQVEPLRSVISR